MSKHRKGFPSETQVKRGERVVHGDKVLEEKLGETISAPAVPANDSKNAVSRKAAFDGVRQSFTNWPTSANRQRGWNATA